MPRGKRGGPGPRAQSWGPGRDRETAPWAVGRGPFDLEVGLILVGRGSEGPERVESRSDLPVGCGRGLRVSAGGLRAPSSRLARPPTRCTRTWLRRLRGRAPTEARRGQTPCALGRSRGREVGGAERRGRYTLPRPRPPLPSLDAPEQDPGASPVRRPRTHSSAPPGQRPVPTANHQVDGPSSGHPHHAAVGPGVQGTAAPQLEKAAGAEGLESEPRAGGERLPVLGAGVAKGRGESSSGHKRPLPSS